MAKMIGLFLSLGLMKVCVSQTLSGTDESRLMANLLSPYNEEYRHSRPVANSGDPITVGIGMALFDIVDFDRETGFGTFTLYFTWSWKDVRLTWDPAEYGNLQILRLPSEKIWIPDILVYNSEIHPSFRDGVVVSYDGNAQFVPLGKFTTRCKDADDADYLCSFRTGSWSLNSAWLNPVPMRNITTVDISDFEGGKFFDIVDTSVVREETKYECCEGSYATVDFHIKMNYVHQSNNGHLFYASAALTLAMLLSMVC